MLEIFFCSNWDQIKSTIVQSIDSLGSFKEILTLNLEVYGMNENYIINL